jgi:hypothetical protein
VIAIAENLTMPSPSLFFALRASSDQNIQVRIVGAVAPDCLGVLGGKATFDACGVCDTNTTNDGTLCGLSQNDTAILRTTSYAPSATSKATYEYPNYLKSQVAPREVEGYVL